jgi:hypoxanthine phosphoribosyltransferase
VCESDFEKFVRIKEPLFPYNNDAFLSLSLSLFLSSLREMKFSADPISRVLHDRDEIASAVEKIASTLDAKFGPTAYENVLFLPCMTGAMFFATDVMRRVYEKANTNDNEMVDVELGSCVATSYENVDASGKGGEEVKGVEVKGDVAGKTVVVIEDIVDTGNTLVALCEKLYALGAKDVHCATLLNKQARRRAECTKAFETLLARENKEDPEDGLYIGIECEDEFVVGYGLDYNGAYRCLPHIGVLTEKAIRGES